MYLAETIKMCECGSRELLSEVFDNKPRGEEEIIGYCWDCSSKLTSYVYKCIVIKIR